MQGEWAGGKGSKGRTSDYKAYTSNYDKIFNKSKKMKAVLKWDVYSDDYEWPKAVDLLEGDVIEWEFDKIASEVIDLWNDRELVAPESIEETAFWYMAHLKDEVLKHIYKLDE